MDNVLAQSTPNTRPAWDVPGGQLTTGGVLEGLYGTLHVVAGGAGADTVGENDKALTRYMPMRIVCSAPSPPRNFFITGAFPGCDIPVHHPGKMGTMDLPSIGNYR